MTPHYLPLLQFLSAATCIGACGYLIHTSWHRTGWCPCHRDESESR